MQHTILYSWTVILHLVSRIELLCLHIQDESQLQGKSIIIKQTHQATTTAFNQIIKAQYLFLTKTNKPTNHIKNGSLKHQVILQALRSF